MEEALRSLLVGDATLTGQVGTRVSWGRRSQATSELPAVVLDRVSAPRDYHMGGAYGLVEARVQVDCLGLTYGAAKNAARAVMAVINGYSGTVSGTVFQRISIESERDYDEQESNAGRYLFVTSIDLLIWHTE